jgi:hypothetical protein
MNFFLTPRGKDSGGPPKPAEERRAAFAEELAAYRKATGKPETRVIPCRCAVTALPFALHFERLSLAHRFQIGRIEAGTESGGECTPRSLFAREPQSRSYDAKEFDWAGYACPHCGNRAGTVYCGECQETICAGRVRSLPNGSKAFACHDACGATGELEACGHVHGGAGESRAGNGGWLQLPKRPAPAKALPGRGRLRLSGPRPR